MTISNVKKVVVFLFRLQKSLLLFLGGGDSGNGMVTAVKAIWIMSLTPGMKLVKSYQCLNFINISISLRSLLLCIESTEIISSCHFARPSDVYSILILFSYCILLELGKKEGGAIWLSIQRHGLLLQIQLIFPPPLFGSLSHISLLINHQVMKQKI